MLLGALAGVGVLLFLLSETVAPVYPEVHAREAMRRAQADSISFVTLGHSHNRAVLFDSLRPDGSGLEGFHLWRSSRDPFETRWAFEQERPKLPYLRAVFVAVAPFAWDNTQIAASARDRRRELYALHPGAGVWHQDVGLRVHARLAPLMRGDHWKGVVYAMAGRPLDFQVESNGWIDDRPRDTVRDAATLDSIAVLTVEAHADVDARAQAADPALCGRAASALAAIPEIAGAAVRVVFYTPPYWPSYGAGLPAASTCDLRGTARTLAATQDHVVYFDDSLHADFVQDAGLFLDADHLNVFGAAQYSALLRDRLADDALARGSLHGDLSAALADP